VQARTDDFEREPDRTLLRCQPSRSALDAGVAAGVIGTAPSRLRAGANDDSKRFAAVVERRAGQAGDLGFRAHNHRPVEPELRFARGPRRGVRSGRPLETARDPRWKRPYTELVYQPMLEVLRYLHENAYKTYIVTGGGQDFVRVYAEKVYGIPPEQVVGTAGGTKFGYAKDGKPFLTKDAKLLLNDNNAGKVEGIHLMIGRRPYAAFGNSTGDRQMLEWTGAGSGARLKMLLLHDDAAREYAYGPAQGLPDTKVGTFTQALYDEAKKDGWTVISMKNDWRRVFSFENPATEARP
jgi:hypothetical protein